MSDAEQRMREARQRRDSAYWTSRLSWEQRSVLERVLELQQPARVKVRDEFGQWVWAVRPALTHEQACGPLGRLRDQEIVRLFAGEEAMGVKDAIRRKDITVRVGVTDDVSAESLAAFARRSLTTLHPDAMPRRRDRFIGRVRMAWRRRWWR